VPAPSNPRLISLARAVAARGRFARNGGVTFGRGRFSREIAAPRLDLSERAALEEAGSKTAFLPFLRAFSATRLVRRIRVARPALRAA